MKNYKSLQMMLKNNFIDLDVKAIKLDIYTYKNYFVFI